MGAQERLSAAALPRIRYFLTAHRHPNDLVCRRGFALPLRGLRGGTDAWAEAGFRSAATRARSLRCDRPDSGIRSRPLLCMEARRFALPLQSKPAGPRWAPSDTEERNSKPKAAMPPCANP